MISAPWSSAKCSWTHYLLYARNHPPNILRVSTAAASRGAVPYNIHSKDPRSSLPLLLFPVPQTNAAKPSSTPTRAQILLNQLRDMAATRAQEEMQAQESSHRSARRLRTFVRTLLIRRHLRHLSHPQPPPAEAAAALLTKKRHHVHSASATAKPRPPVRPPRRDQACRRFRSSWAELSIGAREFYDKFPKHRWLLVMEGVAEVDRDWDVDGEL